MDPYLLFLIFCVIILIIISSISSTSESALIASSKVKLQNLADGNSKKSKSAKAVLILKDKQQKVLSATLILNNIVNLSASSITTIIAYKLSNSNIFIAVATGVLTLVILIFGEMIPKLLATKYPENFMMSLRNVIKFIVFILTPLVTILDTISYFVLGLLKIDINKIDDTFTEEELKTLVDISHEEGILQSEEKEIIQNVFTFSDLMVKDIMIPRADVVFVSIDDNYDKIMKVFKSERYTRIPVYKDNIDNVVGIINMKDFILYSIDGNENFDVKKIIRDPVFIFENKEISEALTELKKLRSSFCVVIDEYGTTAGILTLEDILEELVGDIKDEYDAEDDEKIKKIKDNEYIIDGSMRIEDINEQLGINIVSENVESIGGIILDNLDNLPKEGDFVLFNGMKFRVVKMDNNKIEKVRLYVIEKNS